MPVPEEGESVWERIAVQRERCRITNINLPLDSRLRPPDGTHQPPPPSHPSEGGKAYSDDLRRQVLQMNFNNYDLREAPELVALRTRMLNLSFIFVVDVKVVLYL